MRDELSFSERMKRRVSEEMQRIVWDAASPVFPGDSIKAQLKRAHRNLGRPDYWRVRAAWYGEAGSWSGAVCEEFRFRFAEFRRRQEQRGRAEAAARVAEISQTIEALREIDQDFHCNTIAALERALDAARVLDSPVAEGTAPALTLTHGQAAMTRRDNDHET